MKRVTLTAILLFGVLFAAAAARGEEYGALLDGSEQQAMTQTFQYALENNKTNTSAAWVNPDNGHSGTLVPIRTFVNDEGQYCREYVATIIIDDEEHQGQGTACRQGDGTWLIVSEEPADAYRTIVENNYYVYPYYPYGYADWYLRYPHYVWIDYYPDIFFSFDVVYFSGHHHFHGTKTFHRSRGIRDIPFRRHFRYPRRVREFPTFREPSRFPGQHKIHDGRKGRATRYFRDIRKTRTPNVLKYDRPQPQPQPRQVQRARPFSRSGESRIFRERRQLDGQWMRQGGRHFEREGGFDSNSRSGGWRRGGRR